VRLTGRDWRPAVALAAGLKTASLLVLYTGWSCCSRADYREADGPAGGVYLRGEIWV